MHCLIGKTTAEAVDRCCLHFIDPSAIGAPA